MDLFYIQYKYIFCYLPAPKDQTVLPSAESAKVWALPHTTWPTPEISLTRVGTFRPMLSPRPEVLKDYF